MHSILCTLCIYVVDSVFFNMSITHSFLRWNCSCFSSYRKRTNYKLGFVENTSHTLSILFILEDNL